MLLNALPLLSLEACHKLWHRKRNPDGLSSVGISNHRDRGAIRMLDERDTTIIRPPQDCVDCGASVGQVGSRGPLRMRCDDCKSKARKAVWVATRRSEIPLGTSASCQRCSAAIIRTGSNKRFCGACSVELRRVSDLRRYHARNGKINVPTIGSVGLCEGCESGLVRTRSDNRFCARCLQDRANLLTMTRRETERRAAGIERSAGVAVKCHHCDKSFARKALKQKFCDSCKNQKQIRYIQRRLKVDSVFALNMSVSASIRKSLKSMKAGRSWEGLVGYTVRELKRHLERQFLPGMSWENRGEWHIDHRVPLALHHFETAECPEFRAAWALSNLQPLWALDNLSKSDQRLHLL